MNLDLFRSIFMVLLIRFRRFTCTLDIEKRCVTQSFKNDENSAKNR